MLTELPLTGPMWYSELEARHALSHGLIQWNDVKATFKATGRIPRESVETVLGLMEAAWPHNDQGEPDPLAKASWNNAVGVMSTEFLSRYRVITTEAMLPSLGTSQEPHSIFIDGEEKTIFDHITKIPLVSCCTYRPFWDCIMGWEHVKVACLVYAAETMFQVNRRSILQLQTDSILVANVKRRDHEMKQLAEMTYEEVCQISNGPKGLGKYRKRARDISYPIRQGDSACIFQTKKGKKLPGEHYDRVKRRAELLTLSKVWRDIPVPVQNLSLIHI